MPDFLDTADLSIHQSISEAAAKPTFEAITRAEAVAWSVIDPKHRKRAGKDVVEMDAAEKQVIEVAEKKAMEDRDIATVAEQSAVSAQTLTLLDLINDLLPKPITAEEFADLVRVKYKTLGGA